MSKKRFCANFATACHPEVKMTFLKDAVRASAATGPREDALETIQSGSAVIDSIHSLLAHSMAEQNRESNENRQKLYNMARGLTKALNDMLNCLPGQKEIDAFANQVQKSADRLNSVPEAPHASFKDAAEDLKNAAEDTNQVR